MSDQKPAEKRPLHPAFDVAATFLFATFVVGVMGGLINAFAP